MAELKGEIRDVIDTYIKEKIIEAQTLMVSLGCTLFSKTKPETIMVIGSTMVFGRIFQKKAQEGARFSVIVVDTCPQF